MAPHIVTLIHGTWGRGIVPPYRRQATWTEEWSSLIRALRSELGENAIIEPYPWSGRNSHRARRSAALKLQTLLRDLKHTAPNAKHCIVAHSHGGAVAYYALNVRAIRTQIAAVVTLATPFLHVRRRHWSVMEYGGFHVFLSWGGFWFLFGCVFLARALGLDLGIELGSGPFLVPASLWWGMILLVSKALIPRLARRSKRVLRETQLPSMMPCETTILRATGDEASVVLAVSAFADRVVTISNGLLRGAAILVCLFALPAFAFVFGAGLVGFPGMIVTGAMFWLLDWARLGPMVGWFTELSSLSFFGLVAISSVLSVLSVVYAVVLVLPIAAANMIFGLEFAVLAAYSGDREHPFRAS